MQFRDLQKQYQVLKSDIDQAISQVLTDGNFISGTQVAELEEKLATCVGTKHCVTCGNGTDALTLALMVWGIGAGDAVFVPDFTFFASGETPAYAGATPVFVDVEEDTFNISPASLEEAILEIKREGKLTPPVCSSASDNIPLSEFSFLSDMPAAHPAAPHPLTEWNTVPSWNKIPP